MNREAATNLAIRLSEKYRLHPPVDLEGVARNYAELYYKSLPFSYDIDGISAHIKILGKKPKIIVNTLKPLNRQRFTLAHEIGHVLIPWHVGTILDKLDQAIKNDDPKKYHLLFEYQDMEAEANAFATELLMPATWIADLVKEYSNIAELHKHVSESAQVSMIAAALRIKSFLPFGYAFIHTDPTNRVLKTFLSEKTHFNPPLDTEVFNLSDYERLIEEYFLAEKGANKYYWLKLITQLPLAPNNPNDWRDLFETMMNDFGYAPDEQLHLKRIMNGVVGGANSVLAKREDYSKESLNFVCKTKFDHNESLKHFVQHDLFPYFLSSKIADVFQDKSLRAKNKRSSRKPGKQI